jgi:hypothetical protein
LVIILILNLYGSNTTIKASRLNKIIPDLITLSLAGKTMSFVVELSSLFGLINREGYIG